MANINWEEKLNTKGLPDKIQKQLQQLYDKSILPKEWTPENPVFSIKGIKTFWNRLQKNPRILSELTSCYTGGSPTGTLARDDITPIEATIAEIKQQLKEIGKKWGDIYSTCFSTNHKNGILDINVIESTFPSDKTGTKFSVCFMGLWRLSKIIFKIDESLYQNLVSGIICRVPSAVLDNFPYWSTYVEVPNELCFSCGRQTSLVGLLFTSEAAFTKKPNQPRFKFLVTVFEIDKATGKTTTDTVMQIVEKDGMLGWLPLKEKLARPELLTSCYMTYLSWIAINILSYINVYLRSIYSENKHPAILNPGPILKNNISMWVAAQKNTYWNIGINTTKQSKNRTTGAISRPHGSPSPHIRRGHWHSYWTGPQTAQELKLNWIDPTPVAMPKGETTEKLPQKNKPFKSRSAMPGACRG